MNKTKKIQLLDYAIKRINQYDKVSPTATAYSAAVHELPDCQGCSRTNDECHNCPFAINTDATGACRNDNFFGHEGTMRTTVKEHQNDLIAALKKWCIKFDVPFTIEDA